jgi:hypothetical protein
MLDDKYVDEVEVREPVHYLLSQCHATVEACAPTYFRSAPTMEHRKGYARALFPIRKHSHIEVLLGIVSGFKI